MKLRRIPDSDLLRIRDANTRARLADVPHEMMVVWGEDTQLHLQCMCGYDKPLGVQADPVDIIVEANEHLGELRVRYP